MDENTIKTFLKTNPYVRRYNAQVVIRSRVPKILQKNKIYIIHSATSYRQNTARGHWFCLDTIPVVSKRYKRQKTKDKNYSITLFDSYGRSYPYQNIQNIIKSNIKRFGGRFYFNNRAVQHSLTTICGDLCLWWVVFRALKVHPKIIQKEKFLKNNLKNAQLIPEIISILLNKKDPRKRFDMTLFL